MGLLTGLTLCLSIVITTVNCKNFIQCNNAPSNTFVASPTGCAYYIYCDGEDSFEGSCPMDLMFNIIDGSCDDSANVNCTDVTGPPMANTTLIPSTTLTPIITTWPPVSVNSTTTPASTSISTTTSDGDIVCPSPSRPDEIIYLPSSESCSEYYMCYHGTAIPMTCPNDLEFNSLKGSCDWAQAANCKIGTTTTNPREQCTGQSSGYFAYPNNCRYYYRCTNGMLTIQECPIGFGWDTTRKTCTSTGCAN